MDGEKIYEKYFLLQSEWYFFVVRRLARGRVKLVNKSVTLAKFNTKKKICSTVVCVDGGWRWVVARIVTHSHAWLHGVWW